MSEDNENKPGEFDFDADAAGQGTPFSDDTFDPFNDDGFNLGDEPVGEAAAADDAGLPETGAVSEAISENLGNDFGAPSSFLTGDEPVEQAEAETEAEAAVEEGADTKGKKKKKEKAKKEKKPKPEKKKKEKKPREPGDKESIGLPGTLSLVFGVLLLLGLIACNVMIFLTDAKDLGVGASSVMYYLIGMDVVGLIGIVAVPFLFFLYRKDIDVFKVGLGLSAMAMSLGVILLLTAFFRYDFSIKGPTSMPSTDIPVSAPPAPAGE